MKIHDVIKEPMVTEKGTSAREGENMYTFVVDMRATKIDVRNAVEGLFDVDVSDVRTMVMHGKKYRYKGHAARRSDWKKAIVTLKVGNKIELFEGV